MGMGMSLGFSMRMALICSTCDQDRAKPDPDAFMAGLCGAVPYKVCPNCHKTVSDEYMKDHNYRRRVRRFVARTTKRKAK
jgi:hypothetical protein